jgi:gamma-glutamyl:cysteine ligase YbdK (ATP-grasp superfamily)
VRVKGENQIKAARTTIDGLFMKFVSGRRTRRIAAFGAWTAIILRPITLTAEQFGKSRIASTVRPR